MYHNLKLPNHEDHYDFDRLLHHRCFKLYLDSITLPDLSTLKLQKIQNIFPQKIFELFQVWKNSMHPIKVTSDTQCSRSIVRTKIEPAPGSRSSGIDHCSLSTRFAILMIIGNKTSGTQVCFCVNFIRIHLCRVIKLLQIEGYRIPRSKGLGPNGFL